MEKKKLLLLIEVLKMHLDDRLGLDDAIKTAEILLFNLKRAKMQKRHEEIEKRISELKMDFDKNLLN